MADRFSATTRRHDTAGIIDIAGDLDGDAADALQAAYAEAADGAHRLILNFQGLSYMNSTGIALDATTARDTLTWARSPWPNTARFPSSRSFATRECSRCQELRACPSRKN